MVDKKRLIKTFELELDKIAEEKTPKGAVEETAKTIKEKTSELIKGKIPKKTYQKTITNKAQINLENKKIKYKIIVHIPFEGTTTRPITKIKRNRQQLIDNCMV